MGDALLFTACLLGAAALGGFVGSCCSKGRQTGGHEGRIAELEDRLDALATHCMDELKKLKDRAGDIEDKMQDFYERIYECETLIGDTPTGGLLGRVGALEDMQKVNDAEHQALRNAMLGGRRKHSDG